MSCLFEGVVVGKPYLGKDGRLRTVLLYPDGTKRFKSYPKHLLEVKIGRELTADETCDHKDDDFTNDNPDNLQVLTRAQNAAKAMLLRPPELYHFTCPVCKQPAVKHMSEVRHNWKLGKAGPVCSKECAGLVGKHLIIIETSYDYDSVNKKLTVESKSWEIS